MVWHTSRSYQFGLLLPEDAADVLLEPGCMSSRMRASRFFVLNTRCTGRLTNDWGMLRDSWW